MCSRTDHPPYDDEELGGPQGRDCYIAVAEELDVPRELRDAALASLDEELVDKAYHWAKLNHKRWPPRPRESGWRVSITSW